MYVHIYTTIQFDYYVIFKQTLLWQSAAEGVALFKATATNSCGGQATACFILTACHLCT